MSEELTQPEAKKRGRPAFEVDWAQADKYVKYGASATAIAKILDTTVTTFMRCLKRDRDMDWQEYSEPLFESTKAKIRADIWRKAEEGDKDAINIVKSSLGFSDKKQVEMSGPDGRPIELTDPNRGLTEQELDAKIAGLICELGMKQ